LGDMVRRQDVWATDTWATWFGDKTRMQAILTVKTDLQNENYYYTNVIRALSRKQHAITNKIRYYTLYRPKLDCQASGKMRMCGAADV